MPKQSEVKQLHETVKRAIAMWQKTQPSTAQAKADKEQEFENTEKKEKIVDEEKKILAARKKAMNATMGLVKGMVNGAKGMFDKVRQNFSRATSFVIGHVREVLGPVAEAFDFVKNTFMGFFNSIKGVFTFFFRGVPKWAKKQIKLLSTIADYFRIQLKKDALKGKGDKKKGIGGLFAFLIGGLIALVGSIIGAVARKILLPLEALFNLFRIGPRLRAVRMMLTKRFPAFTTKIKNFFSIFGKNGKIGSVLSKVLTKIPFLSRFFSALRVGFRLLGWPLQIILSVIDFIRGYRATEGDIVDKIVGGLKNAAMNFVGIFLDIAGWIVEKIAGFFGVELQNVGDKLRKWFGLAIDYSPLGMVYKVYKMLRDMGTQEMIQATINKVRGIFDLLTDGGIGMVFGYVKNVISGAKNWLKRKFGWGEDDSAANKEGGLPPEIKSEAVTKAAVAEVGANLSSDQMSQLLGKLDESTAKLIQMLSQAFTGVNQSVANVAVQRGGSAGQQGEVRQIPDEIDNNVVTVRNLSMEMGD